MSLNCYRKLKVTLKPLEVYYICLVDNFKHLKAILLVAYTASFKFRISNKWIIFIIQGHYFSCFKILSVLFLFSFKYFQSCTELTNVSHINRGNWNICNYSNSIWYVQRRSYGKVRNVFQFLEIWIKYVKAWYMWRWQFWNYVRKREL